MIGTHSGNLLLEFDAERPDILHARTSGGELQEEVLFQGLVASKLAEQSAKFVNHGR